MHSTAEIQNMINNLATDFKAETLAAEIIEQGMDPDQVMIRLSGAAKRPYSKDVSAIETDMGSDHKEYVVINAAREGIYDMLPQGLFHQTHSHKHLRSEQEIAAAMKIRRGEESNARKLFSPLEGAFSDLRIDMALIENRLDKRTTYSDLVDIFSTEWAIFKYLNARQSDIFLHLLPVIHIIRGDHTLIGEIVRLFFDINVQISIRNKTMVFVDESFFSTLGGARLGIDFNTGHLQLHEGSDDIWVSLGPMPIHQYQSFMNEGNNRKILDLLFDYLWPIENEVIIETLLLSQHQQAILSDPFNDSNCRLGQDMMLV